MNEDGCLAIIFLTFLAGIMLIVGISILGSLDDDNYKRACFEAGGFPVLRTEIGDICVTETIEVEVPE